jgi:hypothetical protein
LAVILLLSVFVPLAFAKGKSDRVQFGSSIHVSEGEQAGDLVCIGCSVFVQGSCGDIAVIGGSVLVEGDVRGDVAIVGGSAKFGENATVAGDVAVVGGHILRDPGATIKGDVSQKGGAYVLPLLFVIPLIPIILIVALIWYLLSRPRRPVPQQPYPGR